jgi:hypothetical protein
LVVETEGSDRSVTSRGRRFILLQVQWGEVAMATRSVYSWLLAVTLLTSAPVMAGDVAPQAPETVTVVLKDGSRLVGTIAAEDDAAITVHTASGVELRLARDTIESVEHGKRGETPSAAASDDPNDSRLMFAPTGRPLGKGNGYVSNHDVLFPGFAYGMTRNLNVGGGVSMLPGLGLDEQLFYGTAQAAFRPSEKMAFAIGGLYTKGGEGGDDLEAAVAYGVTTFGRPARSLTLGFALASTPEEEPQFDARGHYVGNERRWRSEPILMVGGEASVGRRLAFVSENWLFLDRPLSEQAFGLALRFFSNRISVDAGFVIVPEILDEGFPIPWLSFSYHFGPSRSREASQSPGAGWRPERRNASAR